MAKFAEGFKQRFWSKVKVRRGRSCWEWQGAVAGIPPNHLYGYIQRGGRKLGLIRANRAAWELENGPVPKGLCVLHKCDNPLCVRPAHLFVGTRSDNMYDCWRKGRHRSVAA